jgi:mono/diheme cytochrome c family protein
MRIIGFTMVLYVAAFSAGCKAKTPGTMENRVMTDAKHWVSVRGKNAKNPLPFTPENLAAGKEAFSHFCIVCHGLDGQNTGVPFAERMSPPVPSLASRDVQAYTDGQLKWVIDYGVAPSGMPGSREILNDEEIWSIVIFLRHLPPAQSLGEPPIYAGAAENDCAQPTSGQVSKLSHAVRQGDR